MAFVTIQNHQIRYELAGESNGIPLVFVNGLTQAAHLWGAYIPYMVERGFRVLTFDMLGQGESDKPLLTAGFDRHAAIMGDLIDKLGMSRPYVAGISYGGAVALRYAISYPEKLRGLVAMGAFSEMDGRLKWIGENLFTGLAAVGTEYLQNLFMAYNFSSDWLERNADIIPALRRRGYNLNDQYALQNLMEAAANSPSFSAELPKIQVPTLVINGEYDYITPRKLHDIIRRGIPKSRLVIVQHACHAFTLEYPEVTMRLIHDFAMKVERNAWQGDQTTWVANDDPKGEPLYLPVLGDPLRAIQPAPLPAAEVGQSKTKAPAKAVSKAAAKPAPKQAGAKALSGKPAAKAEPKSTAKPAAKTSGKAAKAVETATTKAAPAAKAKSKTVAGARAAAPALPKTAGKKGGKAQAEANASASPPEKPEEPLVTAKGRMVAKTRTPGVSHVS